MQSWFLGSLKHFFSSLFGVLIPLILVAIIAYWLLYGSLFSLEYGCYAALVAGIALVAGSLYMLKKYAYSSYGMALGGFFLLYGASYQAYLLNQLVPAYFFMIVSLINVCSIIIAMRFNGWLLAFLTMSIVGVLPTLVLDQYMSKLFLLSYFIVVLGLTLLVAYIMKWFELVLFCFIWYLLYNPLLFQFTTVDDKPGLLTLNQVLYGMVTLLVIYTGIPWLHSFLTNKQRVFDSLCIALAGAYTFAMSRFVIHAHLIKVKELPFFIKVLVKDVPSMANIHVQMFFIYALIYGVLFILLLMLNRKSIVVLATLANLCCLSLFGLVYVHSKTFAFIAQLIHFHKFVIKIIV